MESIKVEKIESEEGKLVFIIAGKIVGDLEAGEKINRAILPVAQDSRVLVIDIAGVKGGLGSAVIGLFNSYLVFRKGKRTIFIDPNSRLELSKEAFIEAGAEFLLSREKVEVE